MIVTDLLGAGCPMSSVTLRFRIENMLVQSVPEVKKVINIASTDVSQNPKEMEF